MAVTASGPSLADRVTSYDTIALALQGGGALGAYQAGVYESLDEAGVVPNRLSGISIGAFNAAIIAGNPPERRVARLHEFWDTICSGLPGAPWFDTTTWPKAVNERLGELSAWRTVLAGQPGFFHPRVLPPVGFGLRTTPDQVSWYDTAPLRDTLERLVDFDRLNDARGLHVVVSAVNVRSGNFTRFDNRRQHLGAEHFMASGALPPGLPPIAIDGEYYWDGGVVSNTPLYEVLQEGPVGRNTLVFQVDLWSARGALPHDLMEAAERRKEIQYSSRTRFFTEFMRHTQEQRRLVHDLMALVPDAQRGKAAYRRAEVQQSAALTNVIHLIYTNKSSGAHFRDFEFGREGMHKHWQAGLEDMRHTLSHPDWLAPPSPEEPFVTHDLHRVERV